MAFPERRLRRLRRTPALRRLAAEHRLSIDDLVAPLFVKEGIDAPEPIESMPGVVQHTQESLRKEVRELAGLGIPGVILFGVPATKDPEGSQADAHDGVVQVALRNLRDEVGDALVLMADNCLDEYTDHGHCGILTAGGEVDNDATLERYASIAVAQADAGADVIAPSGMMDGQVGAIRDALDESSHEQTVILAYAAKYASALYGPFRDAAECAPKFGDRRSYQMDAANGREALAEVALDIDEGADMVMVKPALAYLDVIAEVRAEFDVPVAAYHVSGEYAMVKAAAQLGWIDGNAVALEHLLAIKRAGADAILTYFARDVAELAQPNVTHDVDWFARAQAVIPGGVNSPVRAFGAVGGEPFFVATRAGCLPRRHRGSQLPRLRAVVGRVDPRACPSRDRGGGAARRGRRNLVRRADAARSRTRRSDLRARARRSRRCGSCRRAPKPR